MRVAPVAALLLASLAIVAATPAAAAPPAPPGPCQGIVHVYKDTAVAGVRWIPGCSIDVYVHDDLRGCTADDRALGTHAGPYDVRVWMCSPLAVAARDPVAFGCGAQTNNGVADVILTPGKVGCNVEVWLMRGLYCLWGTEKRTVASVGPLTVSQTVCSSGDV